MEHQNGEERGLSDSERVLVVGASWAGLSISETTDLALYHRFRLVLMVLGIRSCHALGPVEQPLYAASYLSIVADHVRPFMTTADQLLLATSSMIMHHATHFLPSDCGAWHRVHCTSPVARSQSYRAPLGCAGTVARWYHFNVGQNLRNDSPGWKYTMKNYGSSNGSTSNEQASF